MTKILAPTETDTNTVSEMKDAMASNLHDRYSDKRQQLNLASALDPRFKELPYLSAEEKEDVFSSLSMEAVRVAEVIRAGVPPMDVPVPAARPAGQVEAVRGAVLCDVLGDAYVARSASVNMSLRDLVHSEIQQYRAAPTIDLTDNPLQWWCDNMYRFVNLANLARCILCIPATSVPSERVFSAAGDIVTQSRSRLKPKHVDMLIFLKKNMK